MIKKSINKQPHFVLFNLRVFVSYFYHKNLAYFEFTNPCWSGGGGDEDIWVKRDDTEKKENIFTLNNY